jgi:ankyrin repeat protein
MFYYTPLYQLGYMPLHLAATTGQLEAIKFLLRFKVDVNATTNVRIVYMSDERQKSVSYYFFPFFLYVLCNPPFP